MSLAKSGNTNYHTGNRCSSRLRSSFSEDSHSYPHIHIGMIAVSIGNLDFYCLPSSPQSILMGRMGHFLYILPSTMGYFQEKSLLYPEIKQFFFKSSSYYKKYHKLWAKTIKKTPFQPILAIIQEQFLLPNQNDPYGKLFCARKNGHLLPEDTRSQSRATSIRTIQRPLFEN